jgi:UDP-glucose:(heptosyl)LPS alpha-1,3-glucosyltransferase
MHIAIIRRKFNPFGGAERFILRTIEGLKNSHIDISVISETWQTPENQQSTELSNQIINVPVMGNSRSSQLKSFQKSVDGILRTHHFDLIQSHERLLGADIYRLGDGIHAAWVDRLSKYKPWYQRLWLKIDPFHRHIIATEKKMAEDKNLTFIANSPLVKRELMDWYNVPEQQITVIENGINTQEFLPSTPLVKMTAKRNLKLSNTRPLVLFVGSGFERKGAFHLVKAMSLLPNFQAMIVGHDKQLKKLSRLVDMLNLADRVHVVGPQYDVKPYLQAADIFCLPSIYDSLPNALLEALCSGLPVVVSDGIGIAEKVISKNAGILSEIHPLSISKAIQIAWANKDQLSHNALSLSKEYDIETKSQEWLNLYNRVIETKKSQQHAHTSH